MKIDLMELHKQLKDSISPVLLLCNFPREYIDYPKFKSVPQDAYEVWLKKQPARVRREIEVMGKEKVRLRTYLLQCGYNVETSLSLLVRNGYLDKHGWFSPNSRYGKGAEVYLPVHSNILKNLTNDQAVRPRRSVTKVPLEEALFLCDSDLTPEEAKSRIQALGLTSKVSIKGDSWRVPVDLPYDL